MVITILVVLVLLGVAGFLAYRKNKAKIDALPGQAVAEEQKLVTQGKAEEQKLVAQGEAVVAEVKAKL